MHKSAGIYQRRQYKIKAFTGIFDEDEGEDFGVEAITEIQVTAYVDASFAIHNDGKSHSGIVIFVGGVEVFCASRKQKCVSKSLIEAELVVLSDNLWFIELFHELISFITNSKIETPLIYQDNTAVISMVTSTKHIQS